MGVLRANKPRAFTRNNLLILQTSWDCTAPSCCWGKPLLCLFSCCWLRNLLALGAGRCLSSRCHTCVTWHGALPRLLPALASATGAHPAAGEGIQTLQQADWCTASLKLLYRIIPRCNMCPAWGLRDNSVYSYPSLLQLSPEANGDFSLSDILQ